MMAGTLEQAAHAASLVRVHHETPEPPLLDLRSDAARAQTTEPEVWNARELPMTLDKLQQALRNPVTS